MIDSTVVDALRLGVRRLARAPGFTLLSTLCLTLGLGSVVTILAVVNGLFVKPLPGLERPEELVTLHLDGPGSFVNVSELREELPGLRDLGAFTADLATVRVDDLAERVLATAATAGYFQVLGPRPTLGRFFVEEEDGPPGAHPVAVVSHDYWSRRLGAEPEAIGSGLWVNGTRVTVVGVAPPGFLGTFAGFPVDVWLPLAMARVVAPGFDPTDRASGALELVGRLAPGATLASAQAELTAAAVRLEARAPAVNRGFRIEARQHTGFDDEIRAPLQVLVAVLSGIAVLVLLISCLNFTNMLLARSAERTREAAIRRALGVGRQELLASLVTENLVLASMGAGGGLLVAHWLSGVFVGFLSALPLRVQLELGVDWRVGVASMLLAGLVGVGTGLVPAIRVSGGALTQALKGAAGSGSSRRGLPSLLLGGQLAMSAALLMIAGLFLQTIAAAASAQPGYRMDDLQVVPFLDASLLGLEGDQLTDFFRAMIRDVGDVPGVTDVAVASSVPMAFGGPADTRVSVPGWEVPPGEDGFEVGFAIVSPEYPRVMGIPVVAGRSFRDEDGPEASFVALLSRTMAGRFWPGEDPVGRRFEALGRELEVVGVLADVTGGLDRRPGLTFYVPHAQSPVGDMDLIVRTTPGAASAARGVAAAIRALDPDLPTAEPRPVEDYVLLSLLPQRVAGTVGAGLGVAGLLLAAMGVYGVVAYSVVQRRREIGVRMAMGADRGAVIGLVLRDVLRLAAWGVSGGLLIALAAGQVVESLLVGISPADPRPLVIGAVTVVGSALLATLAPAVRAAGVDPRVALTSD